MAIQSEKHIENLTDTVGGSITTISKVERCQHAAQQNLSCRVIWTSINK